MVVQVNNVYSVQMLCIVFVYYTAYRYTSNRRKCIKVFAAAVIFAEVYTNTKKGNCIASRYRIACIDCRRIVILIIRRIKVVNTYNIRRMFIKFNVAR